MSISLLLLTGSVSVKSHLIPQSYMSDPQKATWSLPDVPFEASWRILGHRGEKRPYRGDPSHPTHHSRSLLQHFSPLASTMSPFPRKDGLGQGGGCTFLGLVLASRDLGLLAQRVRWLTQSSSRRTLDSDQQQQK